MGSALLFFGTGHGGLEGIRRHVDSIQTFLHVVNKVCILAVCATAIRQKNARATLWKRNSKTAKNGL